MLLSALAATVPISSARSDDQASLTRATLQSGELTLSFSSPIIYRSERFKRPDRLVINLYGVELDRTARDITRMQASWLDRVKVDPILGDSIRLSLYLDDDADVKIRGESPTESLVIGPTSRRSETRDEPEIVRPAPSDDRVPSRPDRVTRTSPDGMIQIEQMKFENDGSVCRLICYLNGSVKPQAFLLTTDRARPRLVLDMPNALVVPAEQSIPVSDSTLISRIRTGVFDRKVARVVLDLKRKINFAVTSDKNTNRVVLTITAANAYQDTTPSANDRVEELPTDGGEGPEGTAPSLEAGSLQGRTIVIDAGHGGHDRGTTGHGLREKDLALDLSRRLQKILQSAGVNAVLTRGDDRYLTLKDRPAVANRLGADAFVAIHLNNTGSKRNIWSGSETYFHFQDPICKELARHIQSNLVQATGLPDRGARSDTTIAKRTGFAVLRHAQVPAVLVEVGYLNHPGDAAKLRNAAFRQRAAEGIMAGLRSFFERYR